MDRTLLKIWAIMARIANAKATVCGRADLYACLDGAERCLLGALQRAGSGPAPLRLIRPQASPGENPPVRRPSDPSP